MGHNSKFDVEGYNVSIVGKHVQVTDAMKNYMMEKISKMERISDDIMDVHVAMDIQKLNHTVTVHMKFSHYKIHVHATTEDMYSAIDKVADKLKTLIRKYKDKLQDHRVEALKDVDLEVNVLSRSEDEVEEVNDAIVHENLIEEENLYKFHRVTSKTKTPLRTLTQEEAVMKLELSGESFLVYKGEENQKIKVIYRMKNDDLGIIEVK